jgi:hypothetical protein
MLDMIGEWLQSGGHGNGLAGAQWIGVIVVVTLVLLAMFGRGKRR